MTSGWEGGGVLGEISLADPVRNAVYIVHISSKGYESIGSEVAVAEELPAWGIQSAWLLLVETVDIFSTCNFA